jgi:hypothetical protein
VTSRWLLPLLVLLLFLALAGVAWTVIHSRDETHPHLVDTP